MSNIEVVVNSPKTIKATLQSEKSTITKLDQQQSRIDPETNENLAIEIDGQTGLPVAPKLGIQGPSGGATEVIQKNFIAGESLSPYKVVYLGSDNRVYLASSATEAHGNRVVGITKESALEQENVLVQFTGNMINNSWSWTEGVSLFVGPTGDLQEECPDLPDDSFVMFFADSINATTIRISINEPYFLTL